MITNLPRFLIISILSVGLLLCAACSDDDDKDDSGINDPSNPQSIADWPDELPAFNYGEFVTAHYDETSKFIGATWANISNPQEAFEGYKAALVAAGWTHDTDGSNTVTFVAAFEKDEQGILFSVARDGTMANLMYVDD